MSINIMQELNGPWSTKVDLTAPYVEVLDANGKSFGTIPTEISSVIVACLIEAPTLGQLALDLPEAVLHNPDYPLGVDEKWLAAAGRIAERLPSSPERALCGPWRARHGSHGVPSVVAADGNVVAFLPSMAFAEAVAFVPYLVPILQDPLGWLDGDLADDGRTLVRRYGSAMVAAF